MIVRPEMPADSEAVRRVISAAFAGVARGDARQGEPGPPAEVALVDNLRADDAWIPDLALVACEGDDVLGHCVTTRARVGDAPALGLGPISVLPHHQLQGVGRALIRQTIVTAHAAGEALICVLGDPSLYSKFAFFDARRVGVLPPEPAWGAYFQALVLDPRHPRGNFSYAAPFGG